jgi:hypothetical protein
VPVEIVSTPSKKGHGVAHVDEQRTAAAVVESIVAATKPPASWRVPEIDRQQLYDDLEWCKTWWEVEQLTSPSHLRLKARQLKKVASAADELRSLLYGDENRIIRLHIGQVWQNDVSFLSLLPVLDELAAAAKRKPSGLDATEVGRSPTSPAGYLFATALPHVFERHFGRRAGISPSHETHKHDGTTIEHDPGPYIRFALAVCEQFQIKIPQGKHQGRSYSEKTIIKAMEDARTNRPRRRM